MAKKETAEEKLLKIIEASKKAKAASSSPAVVAKPSAPRFFISVQKINMILIAAVLAGLFFFVYQIQSGVALLNEDVSISADASPVKGAGLVLIPQMKNPVYYLDKVSSRNIFQPYEKKTGDSSAPQGKVILQTKMSKYKLVGVAWLDVPESATVMLEDTAKRETYFLREGDKIEDVTVKTIFTDRVVFSYANEEITVKL